MEILGIPWWGILLWGSVAIVVSTLAIIGSQGQEKLQQERDAVAREEEHRKFHELGGRL